MLTSSSTLAVAPRRKWAIVPNKNGGEAVARGYHHCHGGSYDSAEDRSPSPDPPRLRAFGTRIRNVPLPPRYRQPTTIAKYNGDTNPELWLNDYPLAIQAGGTDNDYFIIHNLLLFLADSARAWLEHLLPSRIQRWADLKEIFVGNF